MKANNSNFEYVFSVIMPVYNVEAYLVEAIESLINQTIGFEKNVQLVLVNDGSPDNSDEICKRYAKEYPNNIKYIEQENQGVSVARNNGIKEATGMYLNFMDSDDILGEDTLELVHGFFKENRGVKIATIPAKFFGARVGDHMLNSKFDKQRIVNVDVDVADFTQFATATFFHQNAVGDIRFPVNKKYGEDSVFVTDVVMKNKFFGLIPDATYHYRKRIEKTSALDNSSKSLDYYMECLRNHLDVLAHYSKNGTEDVHKYVQNVIMYDIGWRIKYKEVPEPLIGQEKEYLDLICRILKYIDKQTILRQRFLQWHQKHALVNLKYKGDLPNGENYYHTTERDGDLLITDFEGVDIFRLSSGITLDVDIIEYTDGKIQIIGTSGNVFPHEHLEVYAELSNKKRIIAERFPYELMDVYAVGQKIYSYFGVKLQIELKDFKECKDFKIFVRYKDMEFPVQLHFKGQSTSLSSEMKSSYFTADEYIIKYFFKKKMFVILPFNLKNILSRELRCLKELRTNKVKWSSGIFFSRLVTRLRKKYKTKKINIFMDRIEKADDSAEVLYEYFEKNNNSDEKNYFVIEKGSSDYTRLKKKGFNVVDYGSKKHIRLLMLSDCLISTHADKFIYQPFFENEKYFKDLKSYQYVFLQHGVTKCDMSGWLKKSDKNMRIFLTSSKYEHGDIINGTYQFTENEVKLTGMPRFDRLGDGKQEKNILVMPTWRKDIVGEFDPEIGRRTYSEEFKETDYFNSWNNLINNTGFLNAAKENGYKITFVPHPSIRQQICDFDLSNVSLAEYSESYSDLFNKSRLLITDYSSVYFDFAYLKRPLVYYHFDKGNWNEEDGYFSYEEMGFGPVFESEDKVVKYMLDKMARDCLMDKEYLVRVDDFYAFTDKNNCKRVHDEIQKLK